MILISVILGLLLAFGAGLAVGLYVGYAETTARPDTSAFDAVAHPAPPRGGTGKRPRGPQPAHPRIIFMSPRALSREIIEDAYTQGEPWLEAYMKQQLNENRENDNDP